jgi:hypothetical protein
LPVYLESASRWIIGYQYFGGITKWANAPNSETHSPVKMSQAKPYWTLASDALIKISAAGKWAGKLVATNDYYYFEYGNIPPHHTGDTNSPQGGNQVFCDGSVQWINLEKMHKFTQYESGLGPNAQCYFYQDPVDFSANLKDILPYLAATP